MNYTYYLSANTSDGYASFLDDFIGDFSKIVVLKNISTLGKEKLFSKITTLLDQSGTSYDKVIKCGTTADIDAIIIYDKSTVIADEKLFINPVPLYADIIDFGEHFRLDMEIQTELSKVKNKIDVLRKRMFRHLNNAKIIHDRWEKIYIDNIDYDTLNIETENFINGIFNGLSVKKTESDSKNSKRFFGTLLGRGNINYIEDITRDIPKKIYIKGRPGTGKSTFMKKVAAMAEKYNYNIEYYYCAFDSSSLDMVVIRDIGVALFDSTAPHEIYPFASNDEIFDIYDIAVNKGTDEFYKNELMQISCDYDSEIKKAKECLYSCDAYIKIIDNIIYDELVTENCINRIIALSL